MYMQNAMWSLIDAITLFEQDFSLPNETGQLNAATLAGSGARMEVSSEDEKEVAPDGMEIESDHEDDMPRLVKDSKVLLTGMPLSDVCFPGILSLLHGTGI